MHFMHSSLSASASDERMTGDEEIPGQGSPDRQQPRAGQGAPM
jgi:hypothetical protein